MADSSTLSGPVRRIPGDDQKKVEPGIALCLSGGGYRAMLFHVGTLWRLNDAKLLPHLKRLSSVSGGSITAAALGMNWSRLGFQNQWAAGFSTALVQPIRALASRTIDESSIVGGILLPGSISEKVEAKYEKYLFQSDSQKPEVTLQDLPTDTANAAPEVAVEQRVAGTAAPRFVINATNIQSGTLWRFSKPYMGDYQVGLIPNPRVSLAKAVAASSAFPPILSPCRLDVDPRDFDPDTKGPLSYGRFVDDIVLTDGGVYDNLGLETAYKRYKTILVSDGGQKMSPEGEPKSDWARHAIRVLGVIDNQVRSLRKRQLIGAYRAGDRNGAYWSIASHFADYLPSASAFADPLDLAAVPRSKFDELAQVPTRLKAMPADLQQRLINWGFAICDTALRRHAADSLLSEHGVTIGASAVLPYPAAGF